MKQKEFEMFLNFTKLLTNIMKEVAEINKKLTILSRRIHMKDYNEVVRKEKKSRPRCFEDECRCNEEGKYCESPMMAEECNGRIRKKEVIPVTDHRHPDYVFPHGEEKKPAPRRKFPRRDIILKRIEGILKKHKLEYERIYSTFGPTVYRTKYYNVSVKTEVTHRSSKDHDLMIARLAGGEILKLRGVRDVDVKEKKRGSMWPTVSIFVFYNKEKVT